MIFVEELYDIYKLETLEDAQLNQEEKYPSNAEYPLKSHMIMQECGVIVGQRTHFMANNAFKGFVTSKVVEIIEETKEFTTFRTLNSIYKVVKIKPLKGVGNIHLKNS